ncbi:MAG TPA: hypothetical protein VFF96_03500 [Pseudoxanthomonas sp.]|nr:hypothetical protein [Pseudoxanthomonas sp.]
MQSSFRRKAAASAVAVFSAGWLVPLWFAAGAYSSFWQHEVWPALLGQHPLTSFPNLPFSVLLFRVAVVWLGFVILFWSCIGYSVLLRQQKE